MGLLLLAITVHGSLSGPWGQKADGLLLDSFFQTVQESLLIVTIHSTSHTLEPRPGRRGAAAATKHTNDSFIPVAAARFPLSYAGSSDSILDPGRTMVWFRSGPVETHPTSTPVEASRNFR